MKRSRSPVALALVFDDGRVRWSRLAETAAAEAALYPVGAIVGRHLDAMAGELREWRKVRA